MPISTNSNIAILGAGPAGITAAITLAKKGIPVTLIDKDDFPRQKICGDGLSGQVISELRRLHPDWIKDFNNSGLATRSMAARFYSPNLKMMELSFQDADLSLPSGFICKRVDFDDFLLKKALSFKEIRFTGGVNITTLTRTEDGINLIDQTGQVFSTARLLLFAGGSNKRLIRQLDNDLRSGMAEGIGVRGYFQHVAGADEKHAIEIHFLKELLPWYLWIFPFGDGSANVGLALPEEIAGKQKVSLKELLFQLIGSYPHLKERFKDARLQGKTEAGRLPYFTGPTRVSGDRYMLLGDAGYLIDPFTGEGIGNAMASGRYAAEIAAECASTGNFSHDITEKYQQLIQNRLIPELALSQKLQKLACKPALLNLVIGRASRHEKTRELISSMLYDPNVKMKLGRPGFYIKILLGI